MEGTGSGFYVELWYYRKEEEVLRKQRADGIEKRVMHAKVVGKRERVDWETLYLEIYTMARRCTTVSLKHASKCLHRFQAKMKSTIW